MLLYFLTKFCLLIMLSCLFITTLEPYRASKTPPGGKLARVEQLVNEVLSNINMKEGHREKQHFLFSVHASVC